MAAPLPVCYLNGHFLPLQEARISPLDRGFLFADSVYEVLPVFDRRMFRFREHFDRLARSLNEIQIRSPLSHAQWHDVLHELVVRNGGTDMYLYAQVTRGVEFGRNHAFPSEDVEPTVFAFASPLPTLSPEARATGLAAITVEDFRWGRCDIKSTMLLANVLMKQRAAEANAQEAIIVRDGQVLEGASTSVFVVLGETLVTPPNSHRLLPGTTRDVTLELVPGTRVDIRNITLDELRSADEVWISAATRDVLPITNIDGRPVGKGVPGPRWLEVSDAFSKLRGKLAGTPAFVADS